MVGIHEGSFGGNGSGQCRIIPIKIISFGILDNLMVVREDGGVVISPVCAVAGLGGDPYRDGTYEYYINEKKRDNDPKAVGPFILASIMYEELE